jgi:replicative DNA helicase
LKEIITIPDIQDEMIDGFRNGTLRGEDMHFPILTSHFRPLPGDVIVIGGISNMGKSAIWEQLCLLKAVKKGWKACFFSPEQNPPSSWFNSLIHAYIGESTEKWHTNQMTEAKYLKAIEFLKDKFFYINAETEDPTPDHINEKFEKVIKDEGVQICTIDPFQGLINKFRDEGSDDKYVSMFLRKEKRFALKHKVWLTVIVHPNATVTRNKDGNYALLEFSNLRGGSSWAENCDMMIMYDRPFFVTNYTNPLCRVYSAKIKKQKSQGLRGVTLFRFDYKTGRFYELADGNDVMDLAEMDVSGGFSPFEVVEDTQISFLPKETEDAPF